MAPINRISYRDTVFLGRLSYCSRHIERLRKCVESFIDTSHIVNAIIKADIIVSDESIDVIEMDIGVGGGSYYKAFISALYDIDIMEEYIKLITNKPLTQMKIKNEYLRMDYVFNHKKNPIKYDLTECKEQLTHQFGECMIIVNKIHPEIKGGYCSNADFIFTVIYNSDRQTDEVDFAVDEYVNNNLFSEEV